MRILVVEDEAMVAFAIESALSGAGHQVVGLARDEPLALSLATTRQPGIALVDLRLARGSSGAEVARRLYEMGIQTVFVSANPQDCKASAAPGVIGCLSKPFTDADLVATVDAAERLMRGDRPKMIPGNLEIYEP
jgi:DNA-binding response OmpR family regulator